MIYTKGYFTINYFFPKLKEENVDGSRHVLLSVIVFLYFTLNIDLKQISLFTILHGSLQTIRGSDVIHIWRVLNEVFKAHMFNMAEN